MPEAAEIITGLQSLGLRVEEELLSRSGGAGPAEGGALIVKGFPVNVPTRSPFVRRSPYSLSSSGGGIMICKDGEPLVPAEIPERPRFYDRLTGGGVPYHRIALLHGRDCLASTVLQECLYWDTPGRCAFCGIELSLRAGRTPARKTPEELARVAVDARESDGVTHVVLTTGTGRPPGSEVRNLAECARAVKDASGLPIHVQLMPPKSDEDLDMLEESGVDTVGIHVESFDRGVLERMAPHKAALGLERYKAAWRRAVEVFGPNQVSSFLIAGLGESMDSLSEGCRVLADMGVFPFLVPHRPIPGSRLADASPPPAGVMAGLYSDLAAVLESRGLSSGKSKAGCVRCGACSALAAWERPPASLICVPARSRSELEAAFAVRRRVFVEEQGLFSGTDRDSEDERSIHLVAVRDGEVVGTVRVYPVKDRPGHWIGGRLAVVRRERSGGAGEMLVHEAVGTVKRRGCKKFTAAIQEENTGWFERLGWRSLGDPFEFRGRPHRTMEAGLDQAGPRTAVKSASKRGH